MKITDDLGRTFSFKKPPRRIISLCPSVSETLLDLGLEGFLAGRTDYCIHPQNKIESIPGVGGPKSVSIQLLQSLCPDIIIAVKEENDKKTLENLAALNYKCFIFDVNNFSDALNMIEKIGVIFNVEDRAQTMTEGIKKGFEGIGQVLKKLNFIYMTWSSPYIAAGTGNYINSLITGLGFNNCLSKHINRYVRLSLGELKKLSPDIVFLPSEPYNYTLYDKLKFEKIFPSARAVLVDGEMFCWYGSRMLKAAPYIKNLIKEIMQ